MLTRAGRPAPLRQELRALSVEVYAVPAAEQASRPGQRSRARWRTGLWDAYLTGAEERVLDAGRLRLIGTPPPLDAPGAWSGRQIALLDGERTLVLGEVIAIEGERLRARLPAGAEDARTLLVRDAARLADGRLGSAVRFTADRFGYLPPPDLMPHAPYAAVSGPRPVGRVGMLSVCLVNGVFGDPLLHARLRHRRRSLLFDLGEGTRLPARVAHQVSDVFITHAHIDHIAGFLWLLRVAHRRGHTLPPPRPAGPGREHRRPHARHPLGPRGRARPALRGERAARRASAALHGAGRAPRRHAAGGAGGGGRRGARGSGLSRARRNPFARLAGARLRLRARAHAQHPQGPPAGAGPAAGAVAGRAEALRAGGGRRYAHRAARRVGARPRRRWRPTSSSSAPARSWSTPRTSPTARRIAPA